MEHWKQDVEKFITDNLWINNGIAGIIISYIDTHYTVSPKSTPEEPTTDNNESLS